MGGFKLEGSLGCTDTLVSNRFIDEIMPSANGEFVKIYLYLLRALSSNASGLSICHIADIFNHTEKDIIRALKYWEQAGLLDLCFDSNKILTNITLKPVGTDYMTSDGTHVEVHSALGNASVVNNYSVLNQTTDNSEIAKPQPVVSKSSQENTDISDNKASKDNLFTKKVYTANEVAGFRQNAEVVEFLYLAEKYIGKPLTKTDTNSLLFIYDTLSFSPDLIEYLLEYCISNGHKSLRYIEKVAISWAEEGINTVEAARSTTDLFCNTCYPVLKAFGLSGRNPSKGEKDFIIKWTNSYGFSMDIILEACNKTMNQIHNPSFNYTDTILKEWKDKGIKKLDDIKSLDEQHIASTKTKASVKSGTEKNKNAFNNFDQRTYNYDDLEKKLLNTNM
ncbi:MAG: DnaD domain protein [Lachnospiraceae bacterium]|nr:DnaD domain protein [Lachnospiraceae bacterium]